MNAVKDKNILAALKGPAFFREALENGLLGFGRKKALVFFRTDI